LDALLSFDSSTTTTIKPRKKLTSGDLLKLCWMNRIGCDFNYEEAMTAAPPTTSPTTTTTTSRPTTTKGNSNTGLSAMEKVRLCFKYSICSEEEFQEVELRGRESVLRQPRNGEEVRSEPQIRTTTTTRRPTTTTESESYKELKARAAQCFWKGIC